MTRIQVADPATGETIGSVPNLSGDEVAAMARQARAAQPGWERLGFTGRARYLRRFQKWFVTNSDRLAASINAENGKTIDEAHIEIWYCTMACAFWARTAAKYLADRRVRTRSPFAQGRRLLTRYAPVGVVGVIGPWNNPLLNNFGDVIPALAAGNTVILKPSEITPLTSQLLVEMAAECQLPPGVFQVATGDGDTGAVLVDEVDAIMFTGSTRTGREVAQRAAARLIPCGLELGGKDPVLVLRDADLDRAAKMTVFAAMHNAGQTCVSAERVYVEEPVYDDFVARVTELCRQLRLGTSTGFGTTDTGPLTFPPQLDVVTAHVQDAVDRGAHVVVGGHQKGSFFEPTVLVDTTHEMACMRDETFGPTLPIMKVSSAEEAIRLANDTAYGLQASVYTRNRRRGEQIARRLEAGAVTVNDSIANYLALELPMGGWKQSGLGARHGAEGIRKFTRLQSIAVTRFPLRNEIHGMPFKPGGFALVKKAIKLLYGRT